MRYLRPALSLVVFMTLTLGIAYPLLITGVSRMLFPLQASGSLLHRGETLIGSALIGQHFSDPKYFWGRPSATLPQPYNAGASGASNLGPLNPALFDQVNANLAALRAAQPDAASAAAVPVDLVTASASGLDPHISVAGAQYQAARVARARNMKPSAVRALIARLQSAPFFGFIGEPEINVLELNLALDKAGNE